MNDIPEHFKKEKLYNWDDIFYYKNQPCEEVSAIEVGIVKDHAGDRAGSFDIHDTGYIFGRTICGKVYLKILPVNGICPTCNKPKDTHPSFCNNKYHKS